MRFLHESSKKAKKRWGEATYENTTLPVNSCSVPLSQNAAGFGSRIKKNGSKGKKNPNTMPCRIDEFVEEEDWDSDAVLALSSESIHCSSSARACSSSGIHGVNRAVCDRMRRPNTHSSSVSKLVVSR
jgi:hypothetical protein